MSLREVQEKLHERERDGDDDDDDMVVIWVRLSDLNNQSGHMSGVNECDYVNEG